MAKQFLLIPRERYNSLVKAPLPALNENGPIEDAFRESQAILRNPRLGKSVKKAMHDKRLHNYLTLRRREMGKPQKVVLVGDETKKKTAKKVTLKKKAPGAFQQAMEDGEEEEESQTPPRRKRTGSWPSGFYDRVPAGWSPGTTGEFNMPVGWAPGGERADDTPKMSKSSYRRRAPIFKQAFSGTHQGAPRRSAAVKAGQSFRELAEQKSKEIVNDLLQYIRHQPWVFRVDAHGTIHDVNKRAIPGSSVEASVNALVRPVPGAKDPPGTRTLVSLIRSNPGARQIYMQRGEGANHLEPSFGEDKSGGFKPLLWKIC